MSNCINSSKVYCKCQMAIMKYNKGEGINSSKVYCKCSSSNKRRKICQSINSSKVYCKDWLQFNILIKEYLKVLILLYSMYFY